MITKASTAYSRQIATLHQQTINEGFLSKLGVSFLQSLYSFLVKKELVLVYIEEKNVLGFVSCALSSKGIMKRFLFSSPEGLLKLLLALLKFPKLIKPLFETYKAPTRSGSNSGTENVIPQTELLSISVSHKAQKRGIGTQLIKILENELQKKGIQTYKVVAGEKLEKANNFYRKNGFVVAKQITIHGNDVSNVYIKKIEFNPDLNAD